MSWAPRGYAEDVVPIENVRRPAEIKKLDPPRERFTLAGWKRRVRGSIELDPQYRIIVIRYLIID
jgi:hypothetical protein